MTPDDIERMAREADLSEQASRCNGEALWLATGSDLTRFAALVRAQALEDAARVCDGLHKTRTEDPRETTAELCAVVIRALGDTK